MSWECEICGGGRHESHLNCDKIESLNGKQVYEQTVI